MATRRELESLLSRLENVDDLDGSIKSDVSRMRGSLGSNNEKSWDDVRRDNLLFRARNAGNTRVNGQEVQPLTADERAILGLPRPEQQLIGQDVINRNSQRNRNNVKSGLIGDYTPEKYTYRDFKSGETYNPDTDIRVQVDGDRPDFRRREVNPEWQRWMVNQAQEIKGKESGGGEKARPAPVSVIDKMAELQESRRNAQTPKERAKFDEQIAMLRSQYPTLGGGISPNANTSVQGGVQQAVEQGVPANVANQLLGAAALQQGGAAPTPPGEVWSAPKEPIEFSFSDYMP